MRKNVSRFYILTTAEKYRDLTVMALNMVYRNYKEGQEMADMMRAIAK